MSLAELEEEIGRIRLVLEQRSAYLWENELRTRVILIDPILRQLGWSVVDPERVQLEVKSNGNVIDYVLCKEGDTNYAVVEAKAPKHGLLDRHRRQATGYVGEIGARYAILTNGLRWEAWEVVARSPRKDSMVAEVNLATGSVEEIAKSLHRLSYEIL